MGRFCQRVAYDFDWPLKQVWAGYMDFSNPYDPPFGDGWQAWEDTSEGSPISPVFESFDEMVRWCSKHASLWAKEHSEPDMWEMALCYPPFSGAARIFCDQRMMPDSQLPLDDGQLREVVGKATGDWDLSIEEMGFLWKLWQEEVFGEDRMQAVLDEAYVAGRSNEQEALDYLCRNFISLEEIQESIRLLYRHLGYAGIDQGE